MSCNLVSNNLVKFLLVLVVSAFSVSVDAAIEAIYISTSTTPILGGVNGANEGIFRIDVATNTVSLFLDANVIFANNEDIDAFTVRANGNIILSTQSNANIGGLSFGPEDLIEYNPDTGVATSFVASSGFISDKQNVDAVDVLGNGNLVISTTGNATIGDLSFKRGDLVEYNPTTNAATILLNANNFRRNKRQNVNAVDVLHNGDLVLSTINRARIGGLSVERDDLVRYDPVRGVATLLFDGSNFAKNNENIDGVSVIQSSISHIPEPTSLVVWSLLCIALCFHRFSRTVA